MPKKLNKHTISLGSTLVAHFSYWVQIGYLSKTKILEKLIIFTYLPCLINLTEN